MFPIVALLIFCNTVFAKTIRVGKNQPYQKIQAARNASLAGDTIMVEAGNYYEKNLVVNKSVMLIGIGYPVLNGEFKYEIISVKANHVSILGFKLVQSGVSSIVDIAGIKTYDCRDILIAGNILDDTFFGIYIQDGTNCIIKNNKLVASAKTEQESGNGIHCWKSDSLQIIGNSITGHRDGIDF